MGLYLELGVQLLSLNFRAFRGARGVFCPFFVFSFTLVGAGQGGGVWSGFSDLDFAFFVVLIYR